MSPVSMTLNSQRTVSLGTRSSTSRSEIHIEGGAFYVSPTGSGSSYTIGSPGELSAAITAAPTGSTIILLDGTYSTSIFSARSGITFQAANTHGAIVRPPLSWTAANRDTCSSGPEGDGPNIRIHHGDISFDGIIFDGENRTSTGMFVVRAGSMSGSGRIANVTISNCILRNAKYATLYVDLIDNFIFKFNETLDGLNEGFYIQRVDGVEIYGNHVHDLGSNLLDLKNNTSSTDIEVHHNIFENQYEGGLCDQDGVVNLDGQNLHYHDNIIQTATGGQTCCFDYMNLFANNNVHDNVIQNIETDYASILWHQGNNLGLATSRFENNTARSAGTQIRLRHAGSPSAPSGLVISGNNLTTTQIEVDDEIARITGEMELLT